MKILPRTCRTNFLRCRSSEDIKGDFQNFHSRSEILQGYKQHYDCGRQGYTRQNFPVFSPEIEYFRTTESVMLSSSVHVHILHTQVMDEMHERKKTNWNFDSWLKERG